MLVLTRKIGERIDIPSLGVSLSVMEVRGKRVVVGLSAPRIVSIRRGELSPREPIVANSLANKMKEGKVK